MLEILVSTGVGDFKFNSIIELTAFLHSTLGTFSEGSMKISWRKKSDAERLYEVIFPSVVKE